MRYSPYSKKQPKQNKIYVLKLEQGKWYVGKSNDVARRYEQHLQGIHGSAWTKKYKPIKIDYEKNTESPFDEDLEVKKLMIIYGIENVRGGSYIYEKLTKVQIEMLEREVSSALDKCHKCGKTGHFASKCIETKAPIKRAPKSRQGSCYKCGRYGHWATTCYANTTKSGKKIK